MYLAAMLLAWYSPRLALALIVVLPLLYFLPERKLMDALASD